jgi:hypothetical protein
VLTSELCFAVGSLLSADSCRLLLLLPLLRWLAGGCRARRLPVLFSPCRQLAPHLEAVAQAPVALPRRRPLPPVLPLLVAASTLSIHILPTRLVLPGACTAGIGSSTGRSKGLEAMLPSHPPPVCKVTAQVTGHC